MTAFLFFVSFWLIICLVNTTNPLLVMVKRCYSQTAFSYWFHVILSFSLHGIIRYVVLRCSNLPKETQYFWVISSLPKSEGHVLIRIPFIVHFVSIIKCQVAVYSLFNDRMCSVVYWVMGLRWCGGPSAVPCTYIYICVRPKMEEYYSSREHITWHLSSKY